MRLRVRLQITTARIVTSLPDCYKRLRGSAAADASPGWPRWVIVSPRAATSGGKHWSLCSSNKRRSSAQYASNTAATRASDGAGSGGPTRTGRPHATETSTGRGTSQGRPHRPVTSGAGTPVARKMAAVARRPASEVWYAW